MVILDVTNYHLTGCACNTFSQKPPLRLGLGSVCQGLAPCYWVVEGVGLQHYLLVLFFSPDSAKQLSRCLTVKLGFKHFSGAGPYY